MDEARDVIISSPAAALAGRILFTLIFFLSGITHFTDLDRYVALMPQAIPFRPFWVGISGIVELIGATLILTNRYPTPRRLADRDLPGSGDDHGPRGRHGLVAGCADARHPDIVLPEGTRDDRLGAPDQPARRAPISGVAASPRR